MFDAVFDGLTPEQAREFAARWLPAWTGNDPERLASFYTDDAFYCDPAIPLEDGFLNVWHARVPADEGDVEFEGVCTVQMRDGLIRRNEVYFDRTALLAPAPPR